MLNSNYWNQISPQWRYLPLLVLFILFAGETKAAHYNLSFDMSTGSELTMSLQGDLQADNNSVIVTGINTVKVNNATQPLQNSIFDSLTFFAMGGEASPALLSLDGTLLDFVFCLSNTCDSNGFSNGFFFSSSFSESSSIAYFGLGVFEDKLGEPTTLDSQNYRLVPEPQVLSLLIIGFALLSQNSRRKIKG
jgi:hypothetical protein